MEPRLSRQPMNVVSEPQLLLPRKLPIPQTVPRTSTTIPALPAVFPIPKHLPVESNRQPEPYGTPYPLTLKHGTEQVIFPLTPPLPIMRVPTPQAVVTSAIRGSFGMPETPLVK